MEDLSDRRKIYKQGSLTESDITDNPMELFREWYLLAEQSDQVSEVNAMALSTVEDNLIPRTRRVLLKQYTWEGFIFYTNYHSRKGRAISKNPNVCLNFYWESLEKQVTINGIAEKLAPNLSDGYFHSRPLGSQLGAIVSPQSEVIPNRDYLENKIRELELSIKTKDEIKRPEHWGGYLVKPYQIEFWQGRPNRLHDRIVYTLQDMDWIIQRYAP
ncbi:MULTISPECIES: pyridoxamine 5'-phosphate oxidase [unclassified Apibacter]|uniref:pyridoxamine 5'-phosphate oxidase n=1 Tax=unclassified Apibacter TaxID=2630820 RepID=UPI00132B13F6|nr:MULTISPECIES: pyridoxamine 5'-phosphate oxidase [unclassified Apibacter]MCX8676376.1 pyridoxamine 5'-phosphate oxidase [Apibacter sp. B3919]MXO23840.1 pyridoxamine 5'-phosphate oxidase [Apibacter sp. B3924]MXO26482.1 pyridoxamine 5'-phosphate oxidase [Apibacter sp. B3813]MXO28434.1 pyridoxamine 5'-phosphate oxidase [Apibacter sp. B3913]MXO30388.1 pyridoxamine 5'-phosphate oxidase [Apibacter sp. B3912]